MTLNVGVDGASVSPPMQQIKDALLQTFESAVTVISDINKVCCLQCVSP